MKKLLCGLLAFVVLSITHVSAETREDSLLLRDDYPQEYVVVKGDTLWHISGRFLQSPWKWPEVWGVNPQVDNPHLIYPGDVIYLTWVDGKPRLGVRRDSGIYPRARTSPLDQAIPAIPLRDIISFLNDNRVLEEDILKDAPYVLGGKSARIIAGAGDRIYARGSLLEEQRRQGIYRADGEYVDIQSIFYPQPSPDGLEGKILKVLGGVRDGGQFNAVAINRGVREGLEPGHVFAIYRKGERLKDPVTKEFVTLPSERSGELMVFKVFEKVSYGLVMQSTDVVSIGDTLRQP